MRQYAVDFFKTRNEFPLEEILNLERLPRLRSQDPLNTELLEEKRRFHETMLASYIKNVQKISSTDDILWFL
jgi:hypothetical protein